MSINLSDIAAKALEESNKARKPNKDKQRVGTKMSKIELRSDPNVDEHLRNIRHLRSTK